MHIPNLNLGRSPFPSLLQNPGEASAWKQLSPKGGGGTDGSPRAPPSEAKHISQGYLATEHHSPGEGGWRGDSPHGRAPGLRFLTCHLPVSRATCRAHGVPAPIAGKLRFKEVNQRDQDHVITMIMDATVSIINSKN